MFAIPGLLFLARCSRCRSVSFRSVGTQSALERAFYWLLQPCRCSLCGHHFLMFRWQVPIEEMT